MSERVHRLNYWPWARTLHRHATTPEHYCRVRTGAPPNYWPWTSTAEHDHHSKVDVPGTYCHATAPEHYCRVRTGAPTKLLAPGRAHCTATPPRPNTTAVSERVHRLNYWPWTSTAEHDHHSKVDVPGTYCHATATNRHYSGRPGAPTNASSPLTPADTEPASTAPTDLPSDIFPHKSGTQGRLRLHNLD